MRGALCGVCGGGCHCPTFKTAEVHQFRSFFLPSVPPNICRTTAPRKTACRTWRKKKAKGITNSSPHFIFPPWTRQLPKQHRVPGLQPPQMEMPLQPSRVRPGGSTSPKHGKTTLDSGTTLQWPFWHIVADCYGDAAALNVERERASAMGEAPVYAVHVNH